MNLVGTASLNESAAFRLREALHRRREFPVDTSPPIVDSSHCDTLSRDITIVSEEDNAKLPLEVVSLVGRLS